MNQALTYPFFGVIAGFACAALIVVVAGETPGSTEGRGMVLVLGTFLAGAGAIAGAILGGFAMTAQQKLPADPSNDPFQNQ